MWCNLDKKNKLKTQGLVKIRLNFSSEKNDQVASQEHRHLLRVLLYHELEASHVAQYWWSGKFSHHADTIITQHAAQSGLTAIDVAFAQWSIYSEVHQKHPLSYDLFECILANLVRPIQTNSVSHDDELSTFWAATKKFLPSCYSAIRKLRKKTAGDRSSTTTLTAVLNIIAKVALLEPPEQFDLFPVQMYGWLQRESECTWDLRETLTSAVAAGAGEWFNSIVDQRELNSDDDETKLQQLVKIIQLVRSDLQRAIEHYDRIFQE